MNQIYCTTLISSTSAVLLKAWIFHSSDIRSCKSKKRQCKKRNHTQNIAGPIGNGRAGSWTRTYQALFSVLRMQWWTKQKLCAFKEFLWQSERQTHKSRTSDYPEHNRQDTKGCTVKSDSPESEILSAIKPPRIQSHKHRWAMRQFRMATPPPTGFLATLGLPLAEI